MTAKRLHRRFLGLELSPDYTAAIRRPPGQPLEGSLEPNVGGKGRAQAARKRSV